jgi:predicted RNA-binding Zn ribbon-like protein
MADSVLLGLDFANTVSWRLTLQPKEKLAGVADLATWARRTGILSTGQARRLAVRSPARADSLMKRAIRLRESIYRIFAAVSSRRRPPARDLALLNQAVRHASARLELAPGQGRLMWRWMDPAALDYVLRPIARSAAELLTSPDVSRVRVCAGAGCGWLFLDRSRNHTRRWCDMRDCGNREKARRHYQRVRQSIRPKNKR